MGSQCYVIHVRYLSRTTFLAHLWDSVVMYIQYTPAATDRPASSRPSHVDAAQRVRVDPLNGLGQFRLSIPWADGPVVLRSNTAVSVGRASASSKCMT